MIWIKLRWKFGIFDKKCYLHFLKISVDNSERKHKKSKQQNVSCWSFSGSIKKQGHSNIISSLLHFVEISQLSTYEKLQFSLKIVVLTFWGRNGGDLGILHSSLFVSALGCHPPQQTFFYEVNCTLFIEEMVKQIMWTKGKHGEGHEGREKKEGGGRGEQRKEIRGFQQIIQERVKPWHKHNFTFVDLYSIYKFWII